MIGQFKNVQALVSGQTVLIATGATTVVSYKDSTTQLKLSQESPASKSTCFKRAGLLIVDPQKCSTITIYATKFFLDGAKQPCSTTSNHYLLTNCRFSPVPFPSTIDGYRSAVSDKTDNSSLNISKDENLNRFVDSFHRDRPKCYRGISSCSFLNAQSALLNHLTFKPVLLALDLVSTDVGFLIGPWCPSFLSQNQLTRDGPDMVAPFGYSSSGYLSKQIT